MLMKIEQLVPSLNTCIKLKELGFLQETCFFIHNTESLGVCVNMSKHVATYENNVLEERDSNFILVQFACMGSAPTFQEIWNELPDKIEHQNYVFYKVLDTENKYIGYTYLESYAGELWWLIKISIEVIPNITEAAAELYIQLKESEFI